MRSLSIFIVFLVAAELSGCIISKSPNSNNVSMNVGEQKTFSLNVFPSNATYTWFLNENILSNTTKSYLYTATDGIHTLRVEAKHGSSTDKWTWTINSPLFVNPSPYLSSSDSPIKDETSSYFYLEDFEDGILNTPGITSTTGGHVVSPGGSGVYPDSVDFDDGFTDGSGLSGHSFYPDDNGVDPWIMTFVFDKSILGKFPTHVGFVWTDVGHSSNEKGIGYGNILIEVFDSNSNSLGKYGPMLLGDGMYTGETAEDRFFGAIDLDGISKITIEMTDSNDWEIDHIQYGAK